MNSPTEEEIKAFKNGITAFLNRINKEKEQLQTDLADIESPLPTGKICDFGCGMGFTTYCLASILNATESVGVDIDSFAISQAKKWFEGIKLHVQLETKQLLPDDVVYQKANFLLGVPKPPEFMIGNITSGENLPSNVSLAYCRRLLVNSTHGNYEDNSTDVDSITPAIKNIVTTIVNGGWFIAVEESSGGNFSLLLDFIGNSIMIGQC